MLVSTDRLIQVEKKGYIYLSSLLFVDVISVSVTKIKYILFYKGKTAALAKMLLNKAALDPSG